MNPTSEFQGKNVFVAGGSSGINLGIAKAFAAAGANVAIASRSQERVDGAVAELKAISAKLGTQVHGYSADVRNAESIAAALAQAHGAMGDFDVLVSGAAGNFVAPALGMSANGFRTVVDIDLNGSFNVMRNAHQYMVRPGGSLISISAPQAMNPTMLQAHVCAAKAGVDMLIRVLAMEWGPDGLRVNSIIPGPIDGTEGIRRLAPTPEARAMMISSVPLGRMGTLDDVAELALFLGSSKSKYVTGAIIPVDGGSSLGGGRNLGLALPANA